MLLNRQNPLRELDQLMESIDSLWGQVPSLGMPTNVPLDIYEKDNALFVRASLPGMKPEEVEVAFERDVLTIRGETKAEWETTEAKVYRRESRYGRFARSVRIPEGYALDQAEATFKDGVIEIRLPKTEMAMPEVKRIPLRAANEAEKADSPGVNT
jgi:HSP20 family protein